VGNTEPERLLPPITEVKTAPLQERDYQYLVDTIHYDSDEGVQYKVLRVYRHKGLIVVDRELHDPDKPNITRRTFKTIHLRYAVAMPLMAGPPHPMYRSAGPYEAERFSSRQALPSPSEPFESTSEPAVKKRRGAEQSSGSHSTEKPQPGQPRCNELPSYDLRSQSLRGRITEGDGHIDTNPTAAGINEATDWNTDLRILISDLIIDAHSSITFPHQGKRTKPDNLQTIFEPRNHREAMSHPDADLWKQSEDRECNALDNLHFAKVVDIPDGAHLLDSRWVYKVKTDLDNKIALRKSRLCIRGDHAIYGLEYHETYAPVAKLETIRLALAIIVNFKLIPLQLDIGNAYIQSEIEETVYMKAIEGRPLPAGKCLLLLRSLYGMPQAGRNWNGVITQFFISYGMVQVREDLCLFILFVNGEIAIIIAIYVDDILAGFKNQKYKDDFLVALNSKYDVKLIGVPSMLLGLGLTWTKAKPEDLYYNSVKLTARKHINHLLDTINYSHAKHRELPHDPGA